MSAKWSTSLLAAAAIVAAAWAWSLALERSGRGENGNSILEVEGTTHGGENAVFAGEGLTLSPGEDSLPRGLRTPVSVSSQGSPTASEDLGALSVHSRSAAVALPQTGSLTPMTREELKLFTDEYAARVNGAVQELIEAGRYDVIKYQSPGDRLELEQAPAGVIRTWRWVTVGGVQEVRKIDLRPEEYPEIYNLKETLEQMKDSVYDE